MDTDAIRKSFLPSSIRLLLVGESPPIGGKFFYVDSHMTSYTATAFERALEREFSFDGPATFLEYFKASECFLDDICHYPIDGFDRKKREQALAECVPNFVSRLKSYKPEAIAVVLRKIEPHVRIATILAKLNPELYVLPFPGHGHQGKYISEMEKIVRKHAGKAT